MTATEPGVPARRLPLPYGTASTIGSLPHFDPAEAVDFVLRNTPRLPAAPTLPARSPREGMLAQAAVGIRGVTVEDDGTFSIDPSAVDVDEPLADPGFGTDGYVGYRAFLSAVADRTEPVKFQLTGPVTLGVALHALGLDAEVAMRVAVGATRARARALTEWVASRAPQAEQVVFLDEPALMAVVEDGFPCPHVEAVDHVSNVLAVLEPHAITGLHCCGPADWKLLLQAGPQILSLPLDAGVEAAAGTLAGFLDRGGWLAWGAVPTDGPLGTTVERQWRRLSATWCELVQEGCDPVLLRTQAMITPVCGLALHGVPQAEQVLEFTGELAQRLHDQAIGVRLTIGA
jgi:hypothetical protein